MSVVQPLSIISICFGFYTPYFPDKTDMIGIRTKIARKNGDTSAGPSNISQPYVPVKSPGSRNAGDAC
jgi:hypothetical protein